MELVAIILSIIAFLLAVASFVVSVWNTIHIQAQKLSTHTVIPIQPESTKFSEIEKQLEQIAKGSGADQGDLNRNLFQQGLDPDDLV